MSVKRCMREVDSEEFAEWMDEYDASPFGEERADLRSAIVACALVNAWGGKCKVKDFMPDFERKKAKQMSPAVMQMMLRSVAQVVEKK